MFEDKRFLTAKEILEKDFKIDARGYRPQEVDQFLDMVIKDYVDTENTIRKLIAEIKSLEGLKTSDFTLENYEHEETLKGQMAV